MNWYELKNQCIDHVAQQVAGERLPKGHNSDPFTVRLERVERLKREVWPEAVERIKAMNGLQIIGLLTEVLGAEHG